MKIIEIIGDLIYKLKVWRAKRKKQIYSEISLPKKRVPRICQFKGCNERLIGLTYHCPYCNKFHCDAHRLPEEHNCKNPKCPEEMKKNRMIYVGKCTYQNI